MLAPHVTDHVVARNEGLSHIALTLDANLQRSLEALARDRANALGPEISIGILAIDNASGDILARVGSPDYFDVRRAGQVDMTRAIRSPGSTLKPFIYGLAIEDGFVHPESLIDDRPIRYGSYAPENFDMTFQGTVTVRKALQLSLNVPAIALLDRVGPHRLTARIKQAGGDLVLPKDETPGLAMGLGGVGVTLTDLVQLYAGFPQARKHHPLARAPRRSARRDRTAAADGSGRRLAHRQRPDGNAAAGERRAQPHRLQDRHELRLSRRVVGRLRRPLHDRRLGRAAGRRARSGTAGPDGGRADPVRRLRAHRKDPAAACRPRRAAR